MRRGVGIKENVMRTALALFAAVLLAGCATPPPATAIKEPFSVRPEPLVQVSTNGAIYQLDNRPRLPLVLFEDRRARHVGDTLTVQLVEKTEAKRKSDTTDERKANADIDVPSPFILGRGPVFGATTWNPSSNSKLEFKDNQTNSNEVKGSMTVTVVEVLANGNLVVAGENQIAINSDTEYIRLSGIVHPSRIRADNSVLSTQLANVKFESKNTQSMDTAQVGSMMARFFLTLLPF
jgi:flagellar L-ring protein precursor FlgH